MRSGPSTLSVALSTYNGARHLGEQLASLTAQTLRPAELVVADDGSTDGTCSLIHSFAQTAPFPVRLLEPAGRLGPTGSFSRAAEACTGSVVAFCDQDDRWHPDKLARLAVPFADPVVMLAVCDARLVGPNLEPMGRTLWEQVGFRPSGGRLVHPERVFLSQTIAFGLTMALRHSDAMRQALWPVAPRWGHDGWVANVASTLGEVALVDAPLVDYRQHAGQVSSAGTGAGIASRLRPRNAALTPDAAALRSLAARLDAVGEEARGADWWAIRDHASRKATHLAFRESLPMVPGGPLARAPRVVCEAAAGEYRRYSNGWRSAVRDVVWGPDLPGQP